MANSLAMMEFPAVPQKEDHPHPGSFKNPKEQQQKSEGLNQFRSGGHLIPLFIPHNPTAHWYLK